MANAVNAELGKIIVPWIRSNPQMAAAILGGSATTAGAVGTNAVQSYKAANPSLNEAILGPATQNVLATKTPAQIVAMASEARRQGQSVVPPPPVTMIPQPTQVDRLAQEQPNRGWELFKQLGIPLLTTGIGLASDKMLPLATGFQTGYVGERQRQKEKTEDLSSEVKKIMAKQGLKKPVYIFDQESGELKDLTGKVITQDSVPDGAQILYKRKGFSTDDIPALVKGMKEGGTPTAKETAASVAGNVNESFRILKEDNPNASDEEILNYLRSRGEI